MDHGRKHVPLSPSAHRRTFLKQAGTALLAAPAALLLKDLPAQSPAPRTPVPPRTPGVVLNVRDHGAKGDGTSRDTLALQETIDRCSVLGGGDVLIPAGNYLTGAISLHTGVSLRLESGASLLGTSTLADYPITLVRWEGRWIRGYSALISSTDARDISITGPGKIIGGPEIQGRVERSTGLRLPALLEFTNCSGVHVEGCFTRNYGMWSIHPTYCENVSFRNVTVHSGADGIDIDSCRHVTIQGCDFDTADDCISLKSGRGAEGNTLARPTEDVQISDCTFLDANWACIGIGSETSGGIRNVRVERCKCLGARTFAIYIKSRPGRGAFIEDISMSDLDVSGAKLGFLRFNFLDSGKQDEFPVPGDEGIPTVRNFRFSNIRVHDVPTLVEGSGIHPRKPLQGLTLSNITGTCAKGIFLAYTHDAVLRDIRVTGFTGPLLSTHEVTGTGLEAAVPMPAPKLPDPVPAPAIPYKLH